MNKTLNIQFDKNLSFYCLQESRELLLFLHTGLISSWSLKLKFKI
jgi:hypothetical protein